MGETNGNGKILSLDAARSNGIRKGNDFITKQQAYDMVIQECAKVHEHYLQQIPHFVARMIQDALLTYGLIVPQPDTDIAPAETPVVSALPGDTPAPAPFDELLDSLNEATAHAGGKRALKETVVEHPEPAA